MQVCCIRKFMTCRGQQLLPEFDSAVYRQRALSRSEWAQVLTWAAAMEFALTAQVRAGTGPVLCADPFHQDLVP